MVQQSNETLYTTCKISLIAIDLDGTVLDHTYQMHPRTLAAIRQASETAAIVLVTGRTWAKTVRYLELLACCTAAICGLGSVTHNIDGSIRRTRNLDAGTAMRVVETSRRNQWDILTFINGIPHVEHLSGRALNFVDLSHNDIEVVNNLEQLVQRDCEKIVCISPYESELLQARNQLQEIVGARGSVVRSSPSLIEVVDPGATKVAALEALCADLGVSCREVMAIGDSDADAEMFAFAAFGIAIADSDASLHPGAIDTCAPPEHAGVADLLKAYDLFENSRKFDANLQ